MAEDRFANIATISTTQSGANVDSFTELQTGMGIEADRKSARAMLIDQIDYFPTTGTLEQMTASGDDVLMAITTSNNLTTLSDFTDNRILNLMALSRFDMGTAGSGLLIKRPMVHQFFPAIIVAEKRIYLALESAGLASAASASVRIYYREATISEGQLIELVETFRLVS